MSCPPGKVLNPLYGDGTGECIDGAQGVLNNVIDARTLLNAMASTIVGKRVFVTSNLYNGDLGGNDGANAICNKHATDAGLEGWYKAWLSDGRTHLAKSFSNHSMPYVRTDGVQVSVNFDGLLDGNIDAAIDRDEFGRELEPKWGAWTGTKENGRSERKHCKKWTNSDSADGFHGCSSSSSYAWSSCGQNNCSNDYALYCVEQ